MAAFFLNKFFFKGSVSLSGMEAGTKNPVKYCYSTGTKQKTNTMNKH